MADAQMQAHSTAALLQMEEDRLERVKNVMTLSQQLTQTVVSTLDSLDLRLAALEKTVLPVYQETGNLERRKKNIEETLERFDHVISYYSVSEEVEPIIRAGAGASGVECYLASMDRLQHALNFFQSNNSRSVELDNVLLLYNTGVDTLAGEVSTLVEKYSHHINAVAVLDLIDKPDLESALETSGFDIPGDVLRDVGLIASWLAAHDNLDFLTEYARARSNIVLRTLQEFQRHQKSRSNTSARSVDTTLSPLATWRGRGDVQQSGGSLRRRRRHRVTAALERRATRMWSRAQHSLAQAGVSVGSPSTTSGAARSGDSTDDGGPDDTDVDVYWTTVTALLRLLWREQRHLAALVANSGVQQQMVQHVRRAFQQLAEEPLQVLVKGGQTLCHRAAKNHRHQHQQLLATLCLFPLLPQLISSRGDFERLLQGCQPHVRNCVSSTVDIIHHTCVKSLNDFLAGIDKDSEKQVPRDGTVHQTTSNVLMCCDHLTEHSETIGWMLCQHADYSVVSVPTNASQNDALLGRYLSRVINALVRWISSLSEVYSDLSLRAVFRLNNCHYVLTSGAVQLKLAQLVEPRLSHQLQQLISEHQRQYTRCSWNGVLQCLQLDNGDISTLHLDIDKLSDNEKRLLKDRFSTFNREMEAVCRNQRQYSVPDIELRESLKRCNKECVLPSYSHFFDRYCSASFTKNRDKYVRYTPAQVSAMIDNLFDMAA